MKKLFRSEIELTMFVVAEDEAEAWDLIRLHARDEIDNIIDGNLGDATPYEVFNKQELDFNWQDSYPYGDNENKTCQEWLNKILEEKEERERQERIKKELDEKQLKFDLTNEKKPLDV
jgi:hypothetical protein